MEIYKNTRLTNDDIIYNLDITKIYKNELFVNTVYELSDESMKVNKKKINQPIERLELINGYFFNRLDDDDIHKQYAGLIAQEVEKALPEVIIKNNGKKNLSYGRLTSLLVECIKENRKDIKDLRKELDMMYNIINHTD